jgi:hypothetical protein
MNSGSGGRSGWICPSAVEWMVAAQNTYAWNLNFVYITKTTSNDRGKRA